MKIDEIYKPFDYSQYGVYVIKTDITAAGVFKIEDTLPLHIKQIRGIYFTCNSRSAERVIGYISLNFNEGILKNVLLPVINNNTIRHNGHAIPLNETVKSNSIVQGYFYNRVATKRPFTVKIYLHYEK